MAASLATTLLDILILFGIVTGARILATHVVEVSYTVILVLIGAAVSVSGFTIQIPGSPTLYFPMDDRLRDSKGRIGVALNISDTTRSKAPAVTA